MTRGDDAADQVAMSTAIARRRRQKRQLRLRVLGSQLGTVVVLLVVWFWASQEGRVSPLLLPTPEAVVQRLPDLLADPRTWAHLRLTGMELLGAFVLSVTLGLLVGVWAGRSEYSAKLIEPLLLSAYMVPIVILYPIVLLIFGIGPSSKIVFGGLYGFFPVALNTMQGLRNVDAKLIRAAVSMGANERQLARLVRLPAARPIVMSGIRIGAALNLIGVIVGEMLGARAGLGSEIARTTQTFAIPSLYAYIIIALVLVAVFNRLVTQGDAAQPGSSLQG